MKHPLLIPRYLVSDEGYPGMPFRPGQVVTLGLFWKRSTGRYPHGQPYTVVQHNTVKLMWFQQDFERYPAIFRPLGWWELRDPKELPEYVRTSCAVYHVVEYGDLTRGLHFTHRNGGKLIPLQCDAARPSNQKEFETYMRTLKANNARYVQKKSTAA